MGNGRVPSLPPCPEQSSSPLHHLVASNSGFPDFSGAMFLAEELFGRNDTRGKKTLMEVLIQAVSTQEIQVIVWRFSSCRKVLCARLEKTPITLALLPHGTPFRDQKKTGSYYLGRSLKGALSDT